ncbi:hypothetical protein N9W34_01240 [Rickettsiales bacterium]|nr:hypothetical protein [Rickettsiales bacterium]
MEINIKAISKRIIKWGSISYVAIAAIVGTVVMAWPFIVLFYNGMMAPAPFPIYLPNGFIYDRDSERQYASPKAIYDKDWYNKDRERVVIGDVKDVMWHEDTIYGFRQGLAREPYYYICTYGSDCSDSQHLKEADFIRILKERKLPAYDSRIAKTYDQLLWEQSKTDIGKKGG